MALSNTAPQLLTTAPQLVNGATLNTPLIWQHGPCYVSYQNWLLSNAMGKASNVQIVPNKGIGYNSINFGLSGGPACKTLGGYMVGATPAQTPTGLKSQYGPRASMLYLGLNAPINLHTWLTACLSCGNKPSAWANANRIGIPTGGQVYKKPNVLLAMLNGGFTPKSPTRGNRFSTLKVVGQTVAKPKTKAPKK